MSKVWISRVMPGEKQKVEKDKEERVVVNGRIYLIFFSFLLKLDWKIVTACRNQMKKEKCLSRGKMMCSTSHAA